jgi:hypothetical protein
MTIVLSVSVSLFGATSTPPFIFKGGKVTRKIIKSVTIWSQSGLYLYLLIIYIYIDIIIYALGSTLWTSETFWMVGWVIADHFLGLPSLCRLVPWGPILISSHRVLGKWVDTGWSGSSLSVMNLPSTQFQELSTLTWNCWVFFTELIK